ncbi:MAG: hypothetical protein KatS3mg059_0788 [Thermomicrobiales bacterium]|nr:MAG: hypothetical protein KatS3mg059_0788 [Thermomicrobiales bacterium]
MQCARLLVRSQYLFFATRHGHGEAGQPRPIFQSVRSTGTDRDYPGIEPGDELAWVRTSTAGKDQTSILDHARRARRSAFDENDARPMGAARRRGDRDPAGSPADRVIASEVVDPEGARICLVVSPKARPGQAHADRPVSDLQGRGWQRRPRPMKLTPKTGDNRRRGPWFSADQTVVMMSTCRPGDPDSRSRRFRGSAGRRRA